MEKKQGKTDIAYQYIKRKIITGEYKPSSDLSEETLQKELGISRTPIREAIQRLEKERMVIIYPRKGTTVSPISMDLIEDIYEVRELNETAMVISSMRNLDTEWLKDIRRRFTDPDPGIKGEKLRIYYIDLDTELHSTLISYCPNQYLTNMMLQIQDQTLRLRLISSHPGEEKNTMGEHIAIIDAILAKDNKAVERAIKRHLKRSKERTIRYFR